MKKIQNNLKLTVILALLCAISILMGKYLAIRGGDFMRFSLENMPILFAGIAFGPISGLIVGVVADVIGCLMVGYPINPIVTIGAGAIGLVCGIVHLILKRYSVNERLNLVISIVSAHIIGSLIIKTIGLATYYDTPFEILLLWRMLNYLIVSALDGVVLYALFRNKEIKTQIKLIKGDGK